MSDDTAVEDFLFGGSAPSISWHNAKVGTQQGGIITKKEIRQQTSYEDDSVLLYWDEAKQRPRNQLVLTVQTGRNDPEREEDDGLRRLFIKGQMQKAVAQAVKEAGLKAPEVGGRVIIEFTGEEKPEDKKMNPTKLYKAYYTPADAVHLEEGDDGYDDEETQADPEPPKKSSSKKPASKQKKEEEPPDEDKLKAALAAMSPEDREKYGL